jgi:hypothetical protein
MSDEPEQLDAAAPDTPEIQVFGMGGGFVAATINKLVDPTASSLGAQHQTQLIISPTQDALNTRVTSTLIQEFGLDQHAAEALVPAAMIPLVPAAGAGGVPEAPQDGSTYGRLNATWTQVLPLTGGQLLGWLGVKLYAVIDGDSFGPSQLFLRSASGQQKGIIGQTGTSTRWTAQFGSIDPETGSNAGSNFVISRWDDTGTIVDNPLVINRATGVVSLSVGPAGAMDVATKGYVDSKVTVGVASFNTRIGAVTLTSPDVTAALTFAPYNATNPAGYQTAAQVTASLGPYALTSAVPVASSTPPVMDGTVAIGTGTTWARADHVHASDTSRYAATNPSGYQTAAQVTTALAPYQTKAGTTTNDNAVAGQIGEYMGVQRLSTAALALTTNVDAALTSLTLTAGDWDVWGSLGVTMTNPANVMLRGWINPTGTVSPSIDQMGGNAIEPVANGVLQAIVPLTPMRVSIAASTVVTLGTNCSFTSGTISAWGKLMARRAR